jgi:hypothetical protein
MYANIYKVLLLTREEKTNHFTTDTVLITTGFRTWIMKLLLYHNTIILNIRGVIENFLISDFAIE